MQLCAKGVQCSIKEYLIRTGTSLYNMIRAVGEEVGNSILILGRTLWVGIYIPVTTETHFFLELPLQYSR